MPSNKDSKDKVSRNSEYKNNEVPSSKGTTKVNKSFFNETTTISNKKGTENSNKNQKRRK